MWILSYMVVFHNLFGSIFDFSIKSVNKTVNEHFLILLDIMECYCCLLRPAVRDLKTPYTRLGITEIYAYMIKDCFEIQLSTDNDGACGICETCVGRLRDATDFKLQVQRCQAELHARLHSTVDDMDEVKPETSELSTNNETKKEWIIDVKTENEIEIKIEHQEPLIDVPFVDPEEFVADKSSPQFQATLEDDADFKTHSDVAEDDTYWQLETSCQNRDGNSVQICTNTKQSENNSSPKRKAFVKKKTATEIKHKCDICNESFTSISCLRDHKKNHAANDSHICVVCDKKLKNIRSLRKHQKIHQGRKNVCCEICGKQCGSNFHLSVHQRVHSGEKPVTCDMCNKRFANKKNLEVHIRTHTGAKPYSCDICARKFADPSGFRRHSLIHSEDKPFSCDLCSKEFRYKFKLRVHKLTHTGEKPHVCETCGKDFNCKSNFRQHLQTHVKEKKFACEHCSKTYSTKNSLRQHKRVHTTKQTVKSEKL